MKEFLSDNSVFIAIAAALFAMTTMIFAILNYFSRNKRNSKLYYVKLNATRILNNQPTGFNGLTVNYNGIPITSDIIHLSGKMICRGKDINSNNNQITFIAPAGCKWLDISIAQNGNINAIAKVSKNDEQKAIISFDKLRRNKSFIINALLKSSKDLSEMSVDSIHEKIKFEHIIDDADDVKIYNKSISIYDLLLTIAITIPFLFGILKLVNSNEIDLERFMYCSLVAVSIIFVFYFNMKNK